MMKRPAPRYRTSWLAGAILGAILAAAPMRACPVCSGNRIESSRTSSWAALATTGGMLVLPLGMLGGFALWLRRHL